MFCTTHVLFDEFSSRFPSGEFRNLSYSSVLGGDERRDKFLFHCGGSVAVLSRQYANETMGTQNPQAVGQRGRLFTALLSASTDCFCDFFLLGVFVASLFGCGYATLSSL